MTTTSFGNDNRGVQIGNNTGTVNFHSPPPGSKPVDVCRHRLLLTDPEVDRDTVKSIKGQRATGTCEWIRENQFYASWVKGESPCIWISGGPGRGKTMLSLFLIEELEREAQESGKMVLFYICNHQDEKRNSAISVMRSLIYQILTKHPALFDSDQVRVSNLKSFQDQRKADLVLASPQTLWGIFKVLLNACEFPIFCVLDGLDECDDESTRLLSRNLVDYFSSETLELPKLRLIIISRALTGLNTFHEVKLDPDNNEHTESDIQRFVSQKVQELELAIPGFNEIKGQVTKTLLERAEGTFLWVGFVADELSRKTTCTQILDALNEMPKGLPSIYGRILSKTEKERRPVLSKLLRWVAVAFRPLSVEELAVGMSIDETEQLSRQQILIDYISMCGNILQITNGKIAFVHQSAIDYLLEDNLANHTVLKDFYVDQKSAHSEITGVCIDYLEGSVLHRMPLRGYKTLEHSKIHPMFDYTLKNWFKHARDGSAILESDLIFDRPFFQKRSYTRNNWLSTYNCLEKGSCICGYSRLHLASCLGIMTWVEKELRNVIKVWKWRSYTYTIKLPNAMNGPLYYAVMNGQQESVKLLLEKDVVVNDRCDSMSVAVIQNNEAIVRLLLDKFAYSEDEMISLMESAIYVEDYTIARLLLDREARTSLVGKSTWMTSFHKRSSNFDSNLNRRLWVAMKCRHPTIIPLLLDNIRNVNAHIETPLVGNRPPCDGTFLMTAVRAGEIETVTYLLARGANINTRTEMSESVLSVACLRGLSMPFLRLLVESGADVENDLMALKNAISYYGNEEALELLLEYGADPNAEFPTGETALDLATKRGSKEKERLLLDFGATRRASSI